MKIRIVFTEPPYAIMQDIRAEENEKLVFIQDPYNVSRDDDGRQIMSSEQLNISYEEYCIQLKKRIEETIEGQQLDKERVEKITIEGCKEPPNFESIFYCLANTKLHFRSPCQLIVKECSFGGALYVNALQAFVRSAKKHDQAHVLFDVTVTQTSDKSHLSEHDKARLNKESNMTFKEVKPIKIQRLSHNRRIIKSIQSGSKDDMAKPIKALPPSYFFKGNMNQAGSPKSALMHFFSQANQQRNDYTCGPAALKMVADFYTMMQKRKFCGQPISTEIASAWVKLNATPEMKIAAQVQTTEAVGSDLADMRDGLIALGIPVIDNYEGMLATDSETVNDTPELIAYKQTVWQKLRAILELGIPVIINMRNYEDIGHYEVAIGIDSENNIIFAEPGQALDGKLTFEILPKDQFIKRWKNMSGEHHGRFLVPLPNEAALARIESILEDFTHFCNGEKKNSIQTNPPL